MLSGTVPPGPAPHNRLAFTLQPPLNSWLGREPPPRSLEVESLVRVSGRGPLLSESEPHLSKCAIGVRKRVHEICPKRRVTTRHPRAISSERVMPFCVDYSSDPVRNYRMRSCLMLTGRYQTRFGYEFNPIGAQNDDPNAGLPTTEVTLARHLHDAGYATALIGKWQLGAAAAYHPLRRGFDEFFGFLHEGHF